MRCEDYPCCGCGPEGCVNFEKVVECADCGKTYHPDQNTEIYCYACQGNVGDDYYYDFDPDFEPDFEEDPENDGEYYEQEY